MRFELNIFQTILLCCAAAEIGAVICLLVTRNISLIAGLIQIVAMVFVSISILISSRRNAAKG